MENLRASHFALATPAWNLMSSAATTGFHPCSNHRAKDSRRKKIASVLAFAAVFGGLFAAPAEATMNCQSGGVKSVVAEVYLDGAPFVGNKGLATTMNVYNAYERPVLAGENFSLFHMYASTGPSFSSLGNYLEFGWIARRTLFGYTGLAWDVVRNGAEVASGPITTGTRRFKMQHNGVPGGQWLFYIDDVLKYTYTRQTGDPTDSSYMWLSDEVTDSCNAGEQFFSNTWRYSTANLTWYELGTGPVPGNRVTLNDLDGSPAGEPNYDLNNHQNGDVQTPSDFYVGCNSGHGCNIYAP